MDRWGVPGTLEMECAITYRRRTLRAMTRLLHIIIDTIKSYNQGPDDW